MSQEYEAAAKIKTLGTIETYGSGDQRKSRMLCAL